MELLIVIVISGILSFMAVGRLNDTGEVNAHGAAEQIASALQPSRRRRPSPSAGCCT